MRKINYDVQHKPVILQEINNYIGFDCGMDRRSAKNIWAPNSL